MPDVKDLCIEALGMTDNMGALSLKMLEIQDTHNATVAQNTNLTAEVETLKADLAKKDANILDLKNSNAQLYAKVGTEPTPKTNQNSTPTIREYSVLF